MIIDTENDLSLALARLTTQCAVMNDLHARYGRPPIRRREDGFEGLCDIIIFQQISIHAGRSILNRTLDHFGTLTPEAIAAADDETLKACGLSRPKIRTLKAVATACLDGSLDLASLPAQSAEAIRQHLVKVKGIGPWTADIYCLFCLGHADAWPAGDLAVQVAVQEVLMLPARPDAKQMDQIAARWQPYRGVAARMLWHYYGQRKGVNMQPLKD